MPWEAVLVSCRHLVKFLFYTHFSTVNRIFEGSFLSNHLGLCRASLKPWFPKNLVSFLAWVKSLACRQLPPNQDIDSSNQRNPILRQKWLRCVRLPKFACRSLCSLWGQTVSKSQIKFTLFFVRIQSFNLLFY